MTVRYEMRAVTGEDLEDLLELSRHLDSVNLPANPGAIQPLIAASEASFSGEIGDPRRRTYTFILRDLQEGRAVGTSTVVGQLGRRDAPYVYFDVRTEERYSSTLDRHFVHKLLEIGYSYNGPTEIGGLVTHPHYRRSPERLGMQISYVRFLFLAMHRADFQDQVLAELMPPLLPDGTSHLWEAVGRHFTDLSYKEADRLSARNKEFVRGLFPDGEIYASLLPPEAQRVIGEVGRETRGVEKMLRRIGFRYAHRVDPFDGGPHFVAATDDISLVRVSTRRRAAGEPPSAAARVLVAVELDKTPWFRCVAADAQLVGDDAIAIAEPVKRHLGVLPGAVVWALPLH